MKTIPKELESLISKREFKNYHRLCDANFNDDLWRFLNATMDEVRTSTSSRVALQVLKRIGLGDFILFREAVLIRELTGEIALMMRFVQKYLRAVATSAPALELSGNYRGGQLPGTCPKCCELFPSHL
jgi:hypothetical protein